MWPLFFFLRFLGPVLEINYRADIGPGFKILHPGMGVLVSGNAVCGRCLTLTGGNWVSSRRPTRPGDIQLGDDVVLRAHSMVLGPIRVGDGVHNRRWCRGPGRLSTWVGDGGRARASGCSTGGDRRKSGCDRRHSGFRNRRRCAGSHHFRILSVTKEIPIPEARAMSRLPPLRGDVRSGVEKLAAGRSSVGAQFIQRAARARVPSMAIVGRVREATEDAACERLAPETPT